MKKTKNISTSLLLADKIMETCSNFRDCCLDVEKAKVGALVKAYLQEQVREARPLLPQTESPALLTALMYTYEILCDEEMLQETLKRAGQIVGNLPPSQENVKLLSYCYYYVEDEECGALARKMLDSLRGREGYPEADRIFRELVGNH